MKYAVLESGGKQYIAHPGEMIEVDHLALDVGKPVKFTDVLMAVDGTSITVGRPTIKGAVVEGKVAGQVKTRKVLVFKYKPKVRYRRRQGHRQRYTQVSIQRISLPGAVLEKDEAAAATLPVEQVGVAAPGAVRRATPRKRATTARKPAAKPAAKKTARKPSPEKAADSKASKPARRGTAGKPTSRKGTSSTKAEAGRSSSRKKKEVKK